MTARVIAHRGARHRRNGSAIRENTLEAFERAIAIGSEGIELDVRRTADDVLVVHHDAHLPDGAMLRAVDSTDLPQWLPTLAEALETCRDIWLNIEVKNLPSDPDYDADFGISLAVAGLLQAYDAVDRVMVSSFDFQSVQRIRACEPRIPIAWMVWEAGPVQLIERARGVVDAVHPHELLIDRRLMGLARSAGLAVNAWTVNHPDRVLELDRLRVDGIITDNVPMALDVLR